MHHSLRYRHTGWIYFDSQLFTYRICVTLSLVLVLHERGLCTVSHQERMILSWSHQKFQPAKPVLASLYRERCVKNAPKIVVPRTVVSFRANQVASTHSFAHSSPSKGLITCSSIRRIFPRPSFRRFLLLQSVLEPSTLLEEICALPYAGTYVLLKRFLPLYFQRKSHVWSPLRIPQSRSQISRRSLLRWFVIVCLVRYLSRKTEFQILSQ